MMMGEQDKITFLNEWLVRVTGKDTFYPSDLDEMIRNNSDDVDLVYAILRLLSDEIQKGTD